MRYFLLTLIFILLSTSIEASKGVVSVIVNSKIAIPDDFQSGIEEELTSYGYYLCQETGCKNVFFQIKVDITKKSKNIYRFKAKFLDLKNKRALSIKSLYFKGTISDYEKLMLFGKDLTKLIVKNIKTAELKKDKKQNAKTNTKKKKSIIKNKNNTLNTFEKMERLMNKHQNVQKVKPIQKNNTDLFYNSVISHPQIINIR